MLQRVAVCESELRGTLGGWGDLALRGNAGKPCGPKRSAEADAAVPRPG